MHLRPAFRSSPLTKGFLELYFNLHKTIEDGFWTLTKVNITVVELIFVPVSRASPSISRKVLALEEKHR